MKRLLFVLGLLLAVFLVAPAPIEPVAWEPPVHTALTGPYALNERLAAADWWAKELIGPETIVIEPGGTLLTGLADGRIVRLRVGSEAPEVLADTQGRPLGLALHPDGRIIICDAHRGLLALTADRNLTTLATEHAGISFRFADDVAITKAGVIYFTDASARHSIEQFTNDLLEHQTSGRVLRYDSLTQSTSLVANGFSFVNGITLGPDEQFLVVSETGTYRLWRLWLTGDKKGQREVFVDALPGFPDNVRYSPTRRAYWVALGSPRNRLVDQLAGWPALRRLISKLPKAVQPAPERHGLVIAFDESGAPVETLHHRALTSYSPVASVVEHDGWLYLSSFSREGLARVRLTP